MMSEDYTACHWRRLSDLLLCQSTDYWSAHQVYLNRAYIRDKKEVRKGLFTAKGQELTNNCAEETGESDQKPQESANSGSEALNTESETVSSPPEPEDVEERAIYIGDITEDTLSKKMMKCSLSAQVIDTLSDVSSSDEGEARPAEGSTDAQRPEDDDQTAVNSRTEEPADSDDGDDDPETAMMRAMGLPTSFVADRKRSQYEPEEESSGGLSDDEALVCDRRAKQKRSKKSRRAADQLHHDQQRLQEKDKAIRRRFDDFWREKGALLKYTAFVQAYGHYLGEDFWRTVPASVARDDYLCKMMPPPPVGPENSPLKSRTEEDEDDEVVEEEEEEEEEEDEDAVEFDWEVVWPGFVKQLRNRWFMWYLYEKKVRPTAADDATIEAAVAAATVNPGAAPVECDNANPPVLSPPYCAKSSLADELSCLECAVDFEQPNAFEPIVVHAKTNRVAVTHSRLASSTSAHAPVEPGIGATSDDDENGLEEEEEGELEAELTVREDPDLRKYWSQRYRLFSRWDEGVRLDRESWFSVTPEKIARHQAERLSDCSVVVDGFCGAGGNTIQFAQFCDTVIAVDIDPTKLELAAHNARVYGVEDRIEFVCADFLTLAPSLRLDPYSTAVFLSPPWGGPAYLEQRVFDLSDMGGISGFELVEAARRITCNLALYAPRNANVAQLVAMTAPGELVEIEQNFLNNKMKAVTVYFGGIVDDVTASY